MTIIIFIFLGLVVVLVYFIYRGNKNIEILENFYNSFVDNSPFWISLFDNEGRVKTINKFGLGSISWDEKLLINQMLTDILPKDNVNKAIKEVLLGRESSFEALYLKDNNRLITWNFTLIPVQNKNGRIENFFGIGVDITKQRWAEQALWQRERFARSTFDAIPSNVVILDENGVIIDTNISWNRFAKSNNLDVSFFGVSYLEVCRNAKEQGSEDAGKAYDGIQDVISGRQGKFDMIYVSHYSDKDGDKHRWFNMHVTRFPGDGPVNVVIAHEDITERKLAEESLRYREEYFRSIIENTSDIIMILNKDGSIKYQSPAFERLLGYTSEDVVNKKIFDFISNEDRKNAISCFELVLEDIEASKFLELKFKHKNGSYYTIEAVCKNLLNNDAVSGIVVNFRDITERKQMHTHLVQSEKMAVVGQLASGVAHEINNPLTGVLNNVQLMKMLMEQKKDINIDNFKELINDIEESSLRCKKIIQSLLEFSTAKGSFQNINLNEVINKVTNLMEHDMKLENIILKKQLQMDIPVVSGDFQLLQQVIFDLITNARWAIRKETKKKGGTIIIKTYHNKEKNIVSMSISDNGVGIAKENIDKIFEPFFTTKDIGEGTGMGLPIAYKIIKEHKGNIEIQSEVNKGTTFTINLPVSNG